MIRKKYLKVATILFLCFLYLLFLNCAPIVYSPHAQNELIAPYNRPGEVHGIGGGFSLNHWAHLFDIGANYQRTYPAASFHFLHNVYQGTSNFGGFGTIELGFVPNTWQTSGASGYFLWLRPYLGIQYDGGLITGRLSMAPLLFFAEYDHEWNFAVYFAGSDLWLPLCKATDLTAYQLPILLHNRLPSSNIYWGGMRNSPGALGFVGGLEHSFNAQHLLRT